MTSPTFLNIFQSIRLPCNYLLLTRRGINIKVISTSVTVRSRRFLFGGRVQKPAQFVRNWCLFWMPNATIPKISRWRSSHGGGGDDGGGAGDRTTTTTTNTTVDTLLRQPHSPTFLPCCTVRLLFVLWDSFVYLTTEILSFFLTSYISSFSNQFNLVLYIILYQPWKRWILDKYFFKHVISDWFEKIHMCNMRHWEMP